RGGRRVPRSVHDALRGDLPAARERGTARPDPRPHAAGQPDGLAAATRRGLTPTPFLPPATERKRGGLGGREKGETTMRPNDEAFRAALALDALKNPNLRRDERDFAADAFLSGD